MNNYTVTLIFVLIASLIISLRNSQIINATKGEVEKRHVRLLYSVSPTKKPEVVEALSAVPEWLREYFIWHNTQRLYNMNDPSTKFMTLYCPLETRCGGLSDRLRPLPYFLLAAYKTNRVLLLKWQDFDLENFLFPPIGGMDWKMPYDMNVSDRQLTVPSCKILKNLENKSKCEEIWDISIDEKNILVNSREDLYEDFKDMFVTKDHPYGTFSDIMKIMFEPTTQLGQMIQNTMSELGLAPFQYVSAHARFQYPLRVYEGETNFELTTTNEVLDNAINCAYHISSNKNVPIYFTSDSFHQIQTVIEKYSNASIKVVGLTNPRKNIDHPMIKHGIDKSSLFSAFLDLWIMGQSKCVSYGIGGYGLFGARLAGEKCMIKHRVLGGGIKCPKKL